MIKAVYNSYTILLIKDIIFWSANFFIESLMHISEHDFKLELSLTISGVFSINSKSSVEVEASEKNIMKICC